MAFQPFGIPLYRESPKSFQLIPCQERTSKLKSKQAKNGTQRQKSAGDPWKTKPECGAFPKTTLMTLMGHRASRLAYRAWIMEKPWFHCPGSPDGYVLFCIQPRFGWFQTKPKEHHHILWSTLEPRGGMRVVCAAGNRFVRAPDVFQLTQRLHGSWRL